MKTLYVHIGTPKTGTKAIQHFCMENREILGKYGFSYPDTSELCPDFHTRYVRNGHFLIDKFETLAKEKRAEAIEQKYRDGMKIVIDQFLTYDNVILSDEAIYCSTYKRRRSLWDDLVEDGKKHGFVVKVIVYLRRQDEYLASRWNQYVKGDGLTKTWEEFISELPDRRQLDYDKKLETIADVIGRENIIVRRFEKDRFVGGSIYADFLDAVGLELNDEYHIVKEQRNQSLRGNTHEIMRVLNGITELQEGDKNFMRRILRQVGKISGEEYSYSMYSKSECRKIIGRYKASNRQVAEKYLGEKVTNLFDETIPDLPKWNIDNPYMQQDVIRFMAIGMMQLRRENEKLRKAFMEKSKEA